MTIPFDQISFDILTLKKLYTEESINAEELVTYIFDKINSLLHFNTWIHLCDPKEVILEAGKLSKLPKTKQQKLPLYGIPFAVKDNYDVAHLPTTAACREYAYVPEASATVVKKLIDAGAILIGKTNMDQFATGLVGTRSPYGECRNSFNEDYISGGSSSGSAVAVAQGLVSFSLGTDTAGSGRVPAGFNNIVGMKPTRGRLSIDGIVPACKSLDCASIFALTCEDAWRVFNTIKGEDEKDPFSRALKETPLKPFYNHQPLSFKFGVPAQRDLKFFDNPGYQQLYDEAVLNLEKMGGEKVIIDYSIFQKTADLLYGGPWVAERYAALQEFIESQRSSLFPVTGEIIDNGKDYSAIDTFKAFYQLEAYKKKSQQIWQEIDTLLLPTTGTIYTIEEVNQDPIQKNTDLGAYTNFVNLLDLCAIAVPSGFQKNGLPFGVTFIAPSFKDETLSKLGSSYQNQYCHKLGATEWPLPALVNDTLEGDFSDQEQIELVVFGLHLTGQKLNYQLLQLGGQFVSAGETAPTYKMFVVGENKQSERPAVVMANHGGAKIKLEIWKMPLNHLGSFINYIAPPLGIGTIHLADGRKVKGFIAEGGSALDHAEDITRFGGWLAYLDQAVLPHQ